jgi:hypothetical protein
MQNQRKNPKLVQFRWGMILNVNVESATPSDIDDTVVLINVTAETFDRGSDS